MTDVDDLVTWVRTRLDARVRELDEDERVARQLMATPGGVYLDPETADVNVMSLGAHMARWDPERVLRLVAEGRAEVEAKRRILDEHEALTEDWQADDDPVNSQSTFDTASGLEIAIKLLALPVAGREGYREEWRP